MSCSSAVRGMSARSGTFKNVPVMVAFYAVGTSFLIGTIFLGIFPDCFVEGRGLTPFKVVSEYVIIAIFLASFGLLLRERLPLQVTG